MFNFRKNGPQGDQRNAYPNTSGVKFSLAAPYNMPTEVLRDDSFLAALTEMRDDIFDLNFTCRIQPFTRDAYGVFMTPMQSHVHLHDMLSLQEKTGIRVSALFNNIYVPPTKENLALFIRKLHPLYDLGLRSATLPHTLWMKWGNLQTEFPDMVIKNTVLREVRSGQDFWNAATAGFDYVNLHRVVSRDRPALREIGSARDKFAREYGKKVTLSLLNGEGCMGSCPLWVEHYQHTLQHPDTDDPDTRSRVFRMPINVGCMKSEVPGPFPIKFSTVNLSPFRDDFEELLEYVDVIKMGSRLNRDQFTGLLTYVRSLKTRVLPDAESGLGEPPTDESPGQQMLVERWRKTIKTCRFQCWDCSLCADMQLLFDSNIGNN